MDARCTNSVALHRATVVSKARPRTARLADDVSRWRAQVRQRRDSTFRVRSTSESRKLQNETRKKKEREEKQDGMERQLVSFFSRFSSNTST